MIIADITLRFLPAALLALVPAYLTLGLLLFLLFQKLENKYRNLFFLLLCAIFILQFGEGMVRISDSGSVAEFWFFFSNVGGLLTGPLAFHFIISYTQYRRISDNFLILLMIYLPAFFFYVADSAIHSPDFIYKDAFFNWKLHPYAEALAIAERLWIILLITTSLIHLIRFLSGLTPGSPKRNQAIWIAGGITVPLIIGIITEFFMPLILFVDDIPLLPTTLSVFTICAAFAMVKYRFLNIPEIISAESILKNTEDIAAVLNVSGEIIYINDSGKQFFGFPETDTNHTYAAFFSGSSCHDEFTKLVWEKALEMQPVRQYPCVITSARGTDMPVHISTHPVSVPGRSDLVLLMIQRRKEDRANILEKLDIDPGLRELFDCIHEGLVFVDADLVIRAINTAFSNLTGYEKQEATGLQTQECPVLTPESRQKLLEVSRSPEKGKVEVFEMDIIHRSGKIIKTLFTLSALFDAEGKHIGWLRTFTDMTAVHEKEKDLQLFRTILDKSSELIKIIDPETGIILDANEAVFSTLGFSHNEIIGKDIREIIPEVRETTLKAFVSLIRKNASVTFESENLMINGHFFPIEVNATYMEVGERNFLLFMARDITNRKRTEDELKARNSDLSTFIYRVSHDLLSPIATSLGVVNLAKRKLADRDAETRHFLELINISMKKLEKTVKNLHIILNLRNAEVKWAKVNFPDLINEVIESISEVDHFQDVEFFRDIENVDEIYADPSFLKSIFQNLFQNAIKYRGVAFPFINIKLRRRDGNIIIQIRDNGQGIPIELKEKMFDMFVKGSQNPSGSGLGLYIVKTAVEKLKGTISVQSEQGTGTTFTIVLPASGSLHQRPLLSA